MLRHGENRNPDAVRDKALLEALRTGAMARFKAVNDGGMLSVTDIRLSQ